MLGWTPIAHAADLAMPDLANLERQGTAHVELVAFRNMFTGHGVPYLPGSHAHAHFKNFVRLVDTAVRRYESARVELQGAIDRPPERTGVAAVSRALSDLEETFSRLHRALRLLGRLKEAREAPVNATDLKPFEEGAVRRIRHASEHIEDFLSRGELGEDREVMLCVWREGITFAGEQISYVTLAGWLRRLHGLARQLIDHDPLVGTRRTARQA